MENKYICTAFIHYKDGWMATEWPLENSFPLFQKLRFKTSRGKWQWISEV